MTRLQAALTELHQALDLVELGLGEHLLDRLAAFGQGGRAVAQEAQDAVEVFPAAVDQDPT